MRHMTLMIAALLAGATACSSEGSAPGSSSNAARAAQPVASNAVVGPNRLTASAPGGGGAPTHAAAASASIDTLAKLVSQGQPESRGFHSVDEVQAAVLAVPLPMYLLGLYPLRDYRTGQDPRALLIDEEAVLYPLTVGGEVRTSVVVKKRPGDVWEASSFGHANLAKAAHAGRRGVSAARGVAEGSMSLVDVPTLGARLLSHEENGVPMLTPLFDIPGTEFHARVTRRADEVLAALRTLAEQVDPNAPN